MDKDRLPQHGDVVQEDGFWKLRWRSNPALTPTHLNGAQRKPYWIGPATGPERLSEEEAQETAWNGVLAQLEKSSLAQASAMTVTDFVEQKFVPEHVTVKSTSGRTHYQAILKHVITPEEVQRVFGVDAEQSKTRLKTAADWPYLGEVRLCDVRPEHVQRLVAAAMERGYSTQTVTHIRNVVSAIFSHAKRERCYMGENPASQVMLPGMTRKEAHSLTLAQARDVIQAMQYPEREMTLIAILTNLNVAEICGLQWKHVNLTDRSVDSDGEMVGPRTIAVRGQWYRGELSSVKKGRRKNLPIPQVLLPILQRLSRRARYTGPEDFVLVSQAGTPVNQINIAARRLKLIGKELKMPWLSWHVFRRTHTTLVYEFGMQFQQQIASTVQAETRQSLDERSGARPAAR